MFKKLFFSVFLLTTLIFTLNAQVALALVSYDINGTVLCCIGQNLDDCLDAAGANGPEIEECFRDAECAVGSCVGITTDDIKAACSIYNLSACDRASCQKSPLNHAWNILDDMCESSESCTASSLLVVTGTVYGKICTSSSKPACGTYPCVYYDITSESACSAKPGNWLAPYNSYAFCEAKNPIVTCTSFTYSPWSACTNGSQSRTITAYTPTGCTGGTPEPLEQQCQTTPTSSCTAEDPIDCDKETCQETLNYAWELVSDLCISPAECESAASVIVNDTAYGKICAVAGSTSENVPCTAERTTRCIYYDIKTKEDCDKKPGRWALAETATSNMKFCHQTSSPSENICTWTYSDWSVCDATSKTQTRTVTAGPTPTGCTGGTQEALSKSCTPPTGCAALGSANCSSNPACQLNGSTCADKPKLTETCTGTGAGNCSEGQCIPFEGKSICRKTCTANTDCPTGNFCFDSGSGKFCRTLLQTGAACTSGDVCASGTCDANECKAPIKCTDYSTTDTTGTACNSHPECEWVSNACSTKAAGGATPPGGDTPAAPEPSTFAIPNFLSAGGALEDPSSLVGRIIKFIMGFAGTIALVTFMYGGALWLISAGRMDYVSKGKNYMIWAVIGLALVFGSYIILGQVLAILGK